MAGKVIRYPHFFAQSPITDHFHARSPRAARLWTRVLSTVHVYFSHRGLPRFAVRLASCQFSDSMHGGFALHGSFIATKQKCRQLRPGAGALPASTSANRAPAVRMMMSSSPGQFSRVTNSQKVCMDLTCLCMVCTRFSIVRT